MVGYNAVIFAAQRRDERILSVSNTPRSEVIRIPVPPRSTQVFIILVLLIGAVLLATNGIGQGSVVRASLSATPTITLTPQPTRNPFAFNGYRPFASPDGVLTLEFPDTWTFVPDPQNPKSYFFAPDAGLQSALVIQMRVLPSSNFVGSLPGLTESSTPRQILAAAFAQGTPGAQQPIDDVTASGLVGARAFQPNALDQSNAPSGQSLETWLLALDATHLLLIQAIAPATLWNQTQPVLKHLTDTLRVNVPNAVAAPIGTAVPTAQR